MNRRRLLFSAPFGIAALRGTLLAQAGEVKRVTLTPRLDNVIGPVTQDFIGLSYETTQLGEPEYFSRSNSGLVSFFRTLSSSGVLRLGGNTVEFTWFKPDALSVAPPYKALPTQPAELTAITPEALRNLRGFLDATGWSCIYSLNLGTGSPERASQEAVVAARELGPRLKYFQIGNEPNNFIRYKLRPATWNAATYIEEWLPYAKAILESVPGAKIGGPDMGAERAWMMAFAERVPSVLGSSLVEMTDHFYAEGPPTSPESTIANLFSPKKICKEIAVMEESAKVSHRSYRMTEVNSCYLGGKPGVSDALASALWAADLSLLLASHGFSGVNFHGGSARQIRASLGGTLPGDAVSKAAAASDSYYTPIASGEGSSYSARPIFYGIMLAAQFAGSRLVSLEGVPEGVRAYAALDREENLLVALIHPLESPLAVNLIPGSPFHTATVQLLSAPALDSTSGVTWGGSRVETDGKLHPSQKRDTRKFSNRGLQLTVDPHSAMLVTFHRK